MEKIELKAEIRKPKEKKAGFIPAILYGRGIENVMIWLEEKNFNKIYQEAGESTLLELSVKGEKEITHNVLIYDIQTDPVSDRIGHVDFYQVRMDEKLETEVELVFIGQSVAVKELGGVLVKNIDALEVRCLPADLPKNIEVDISALATFEDSIRVKDLQIGEKVEITIDPETVVAVVSPPRSEKELEQLDEEVEGDISQVEGISEEKEEEPENKDEKAEVKEEKPATE